MTENLLANTLWLIDDDPALRLILEDTFADAGLKVVVFSSAKGAWARLNDVLGGHEPISVLPDAILTDIRMPMMDGLSFSEWVHDKFPELPIVIMTAHSDLKSAVDSYQTGAFEYLPKPFDLDDAVAVIRKAIKGSMANRQTDHQTTSTVSSAKNHPTQTLADSFETHAASSSLSPHKQTAVSNKKDQVAAQSTAKKASINKSNKPAKKSKQKTHIIGQSVAMQTVFRAIGRLAASPITVLITGESGTGKELVAGALHEHSPRADKPFIALNMAAIPHDLIESELFGHEKGAFTGATTARQGRFEQANGGTLFLDEIGDMPFSTQTRLLRVLANGEFFRVGGQKPIHVDVRIVAATHQNLEQRVKEGKFREDLFYRLNVIRLPLPPLRARREDIPALVDFFMQRSAKEMETDEKRLSAAAMQLMQAFDWLGNVRQLENACRWITVMATGDEVLVEDLPPELLTFAGTLPYDSQLPSAPTSVNIHNAQSTHDIQNAPFAATTEGKLSSNLDVAFSSHATPVQKLPNSPKFANELPDSPFASSIPNLTESMPHHHTHSHIDQHNRQHNYQHNHQHNPQQGHQQDAYGSDTHRPNHDAISHKTHPSHFDAHSSLHHSSDHIANPSGVAITWQHTLQTWANRALSRGETDILQQAIPEFERVLIEVALQHTRGRKGEAAELLGWGRNTLTRKLKQIEEASDGTDYPTY